VKNATVKTTPTGALAGAFIELVKEAEGRGGWWRSSPLLSATGLDYHLHESGWEVRRIVPDGYLLVSEAELATALQETILTSIDQYKGPGMGAYRTPFRDLTASQKRHVMQDAAAICAALVAAQEKGETA
jgi:hypothetical protein